MTNHAIFLNGIPGAGKSTVARQVVNRCSSYRVVSGDDIVRQVPYQQRVRQTQLIWSRMLGAVEAGLASSKVLMDATLSANQVIEARDRLGDAAAFVIVRIDEETRDRRQAQRDRNGRPLGFEWRPEFNSMPGRDDLYDLVLDARLLTAEQCARHVLQFALGHWSDAVE